MVYRFSWLAGAVGIGLAFFELSAILRASTSGTPWQLPILVSVLLGAAITWLLVAYRLHALVVIGVNAAAFGIMAIVFTASNTFRGVLPTAATWDEIGFEIGRAVEIIRYGVEPVRPVPGLVMILALVFWTLGFLLVAGLLNDRPFVAVLTPQIVALQFVIIDRRPKGIVHVAIFLAIVAFGLIAVRTDERDRGSGRLQRVDSSTPPSRRPSPAVTTLVVFAILAAVGVVALLGDRVPNDGVLSWRTPGGYSDASYSGSAAYNPYTTIQQQVISQTNQPLFLARIEGMRPDHVRFRTVTLDVFDGNRWRTDRIQAYATDEEPWVEESQVYRGETVDVTASIRIQSLSQPWLPAPSTTTDAVATDDDDDRALRVRRLDGTLYLPGDVSYEGMEYIVTADVPRYTARDLAALARADDGTLSPLFEAAAEDGQFIPDLEAPLEPLALPNEDYWTEVPDDVGPVVGAIAAQVTDKLATNFERAIALEQFFRSPDTFTYNAKVPAEFMATSVEDWLAEPDEENPYRHQGYCEQFATSMALMARTLGMPARVVLGFTAGVPLNDDTVQVMDRNAHSWVEIWIPRFGWMSFDPTPRAGYAAQTADQRLASEFDFVPSAYLEDIPDPSLVDAEGGQAGPGDGRFEPLDPVDRTRGAGGGGGSEDSTGFSVPAWVGEALAVALVLAVITAFAPVAKGVRARRRVRRLAQGDIAAAWEDITDRLADLGEPVDPASTPLEAARDIDEAFVPLARTYGASLYGERRSSTTLIDRAETEHTAARLHLSTRYSRLERLAAAYRPTRLIERWRRFVGNRNGNGSESDTDPS